MIEPTQAQIEAARLSEGSLHNIAHARYLVERASPDNSEVCFDYTLVADLLSIIDRLTAAAEVKMTNLIDDPNSASGKRIDPALRDFIKDTPYSEPNDGWAAEQTKPTQAQIDAVRDRETLIAATIERCAQVADAFSDLCRCEKDVALQISAAIRKLKD